MSESRASGLDACVHCGLCLPACPTYDLNGDELDAPRGRLVLMSALAAGTLEDPDVARRHLGACLGCRACETACPSGVAYGSLLQEARTHLARGRPAGWLRHLLLDRGLASPAGALWLLRAAWLARRTGVLSLARRLPGRAGAAARVAPDASWTPFSRSVPGKLAAEGPRRGTVALLPGCVMDQGFSDVQRDTVRVLRAAGFDVLVPRGPACCGALQAHVGEERSARATLGRLATALDGLGAFDALVVNAAGCGSHMKETDWAHRARVFDATEWLDRHGLGFTPVERPARRVLYDDPCHLLHGQRIREAPRRLLAALPGVELVEAPGPHRCCGSAGVHNIEDPDTADELLHNKVHALLAVAPDVVATANPGCHLQIAAGLRAAGSRVPVRHVLSFVAEAIPPPGITSRSDGPSAR